MKTNRRNFLQITGSVALGSVLLPRRFYSLDEMAPDCHKVKEFGLQLYTLRDDLPGDTKGVLQKVASYGYKQIESYEGPKGMFWGMKNTGFKKFMDDLGMTMISSHCDIHKDFERKVDDAAEIGMKYLIYNWPGSSQPIDEFKKHAALFNRCGEICKKAGIRFANHGYQSTFTAIDGVFPQDLLMQETDPELVDHQMDIYWVVVAGQDPAAWFKKYPGRYRLCHIKDREKGATKREATCNIGTGSIDFATILMTARKNGMKYYIVEQEAYPTHPPLEAVRLDAEYMKKMKLRKS